VSRQEEHFINLLISIVSVLLTFSCLLSFTSIRTTKPEREAKLEKIAEYFYIISLAGILAVVLLIAKNYFK
jgi:hypothetical protein